MKSVKILIDKGKEGNQTGEVIWNADFSDEESFNCFRIRIFNMHTSFQELMVEVSTFPTWTGMKMH